MQSVDDFVTYHDDIQFAQLVKQQVSCNYAILHEYDSTVPGFIDPSTGVSTTYPDGSNQDVNAIYPGKEYFGRPGERLQGFSPNIPNQEYFNHVGMILQIIAVNLDLPLQVLLLDAKQTNFSGWRGAIDQAKPRWRDLQRDFCNVFHKPIYRWKVAEWLAEDPVLRRAVTRGDITLANPTWRYPAWPYIEPRTDTEADVLSDGAGMNSRRRLLAVKGFEIEEITTERIVDNENTIFQCKQSAMRINDAIDDGNPVTWQEVWNIPLQKGLAITWSKSQTDTTQGADNADSTG